MATTNKIVNSTSLEEMITLQKGYIDAQIQNLQTRVDDIEGMSDRVTDLDKKVSDMQRDFSFWSGLLGEINGLSSTSLTPKLDPQYAGILPVATPGNKKLLDVWVPVIMSFSNPGNVTIDSKKRARELMRNNFFRYTDGSYAPTVLISQEQWDDFHQKNVYIWDEVRGQMQLFDLFGAYNDSEEAIKAYWVEHKALIKSMVEDYFYLQDWVFTYDPLLDSQPSLIELRRAYQFILPREEEGRVRRLYISNDPTKHNTDLSGDPHIGAFREIRWIRPWETTTKGYSIGIANKQDLYLVDNIQRTDISGIDTSNFRTKAIMFEPGNLSGFDYTPYKLPPTALSPCPVTIEEAFVASIHARVPLNIFDIRPPEGGFIEKTRGPIVNFKDLPDNTHLFEPWANTQYNGGSQPIKQSRTYPIYGYSLKGASALVNEMINNNPNYVQQKSVPAAVAGYHAYNTFITCLELYSKDRNFLDEYYVDLSVTSAPNSVNSVYKYGGLIYYDGISQYQYKKWDNTISPIIDKYGSSSLLYSSVCGGRPLQMCMEAQMAISMANELDILDYTGIPTFPSNGDVIAIPAFPFYGFAYYYQNFKKGYMTGTVYRINPVNLKNSLGPEPAKTLKGRLILPLSVQNGINLSGDMWAMYGADLRVVGKVYQVNPIKLGIDIYFQPDQRLWDIGNHNPVNIPDSPIANNMAYKLVGSKSFTEDTIFTFRDHPFLRRSYTPFDYNDTILNPNDGEGSEDGYTPNPPDGPNNIRQAECSRLLWDTLWAGCENLGSLSSLEGKEIPLVLRSRGYIHFDSCNPRLVDIKHSASYQWAGNSVSTGFYIQTLVELTNHF